MAQKSVGTMAMLVTAVTASAAVPSSAIANNSASFKLRAVVPVACEVEFIPVSSSASNAADVIRLGELRESCNSPDGYKLEVRYTPDTLRGVTLYLGNERIVLDGSGRAFIPGSAGPAVQTRMLSAEIGENGFDTRFSGGGHRELKLAADQVRCKPASRFLLRYPIITEPSDPGRVVSFV